MLADYSFAYALFAGREELRTIEPAKELDQFRDGPRQPVWWLGPRPAPLSPWKYS